MYTKYKQGFVEQYDIWLVDGGLHSPSAAEIIVHRLNYTYENEVCMGSNRFWVSRIFCRVPSPWFFCLIEKNMARVAPRRLYLNGYVCSWGRCMDEAWEWARRWQNARSGGLAITNKV